jgi:ribosome-dependent ATPase
MSALMKRVYSSIDIVFGSAPTLISLSRTAGVATAFVIASCSFVTISRGVFSKALAFPDLQMSFVPLLITLPVLIGLSAALLPKQET